MSPRLASALVLSSSHFLHVCIIVHLFAVPVSLCLCIRCHEVLQCHFQLWLNLVANVVLHSDQLVLCLVQHSVSLEAVAAYMCICLSVCLSVCVYIYLTVYMCMICMCMCTHVLDAFCHGELVPMHETYTRHVEISSLCMYANIAYYLQTNITCVHPNTHT